VGTVGSYSSISEGKFVVDGGSVVDKGRSSCQVVK